MSLREYSFLKISLNLYILFILALGCKKKVCKNRTGCVQHFLYILFGKMSNILFVRGKSFQRAIVSGYKKIKRSIVLNVTLS
jgi:hypothetical protein